jgi:S-formylglutathione hydrolase FrmB
MKPRWNNVALCTLFTLGTVWATPLLAQEAQTPGLAPAPVTTPTEAKAPDAIPCASFRLEFPPALFPDGFSGRVYVALSTRPREPRLDMGDWFSGPQVISFDVSTAKPGELLDIPTSALTFRAASYADIPAKPYYAQAIARVNKDSPSPGKGGGDVVSEVTKIDFDPKGAGGVATLTFSRAVKADEIKQTESIHVVEIKSELLSTFHGRDVMIRAGVHTPKDWKPIPIEQSDRNEPLPALYFITGFGGGAEFIRTLPNILGRGNSEGVVLVVPDPLCFEGHSVFADSANNGPWGEALIKELIPAVESKFNAGGSGANRYVTGISSGGWGSLWLQVAYPDSFAACWSHCPDPVDFRDFQKIDIYGPDANMYKDAQGERRPLARNPAGKALLFYDDFVRQETVMGPGGQIGSFEAVFSPRGADGKPTPLFDRATGAINPIVAKAWEKYDIRLKLEREWPTIGPKIKGKVHLYAGEKDMFLLDGAAILLKDSLAKLGSDAEVTIVPGMNHTMHRAGIQAMMERIRNVPQEAPTAEKK